MARSTSRGSSAASASTDLKVIGKTRKTGTKITFQPDTEIFPTIEHEPDTLTHRLGELAYLNGGVKITFTNEKTGETQVFQKRTASSRSWST